MTRKPSEPGYVVAKDAGFVVDAPGPDGIAAVYVARLPDGPIFVLEATAALIWHEALAVAREGEGVADRVASQVGLHADDVAWHVERFLDDMQSRGFIDRA